VPDFDPSLISDPRAIGLKLLRHSVPYHMYRTAVHGTLAKSAHIHKKTGLDVSEWKVMLIVGTFAPLSTKDIAAQSSLDKPTISRTTERLVARKLLTSATDPGDRRKVVLKLTKSGHDKYVRLLHALSSWDAVLLKCLSAKQVATLAEIVRLIDSRIDQVNAELENALPAKRRPARRQLPLADRPL
jgi:DNA-binding MarR family transcriptional regulator